jgi:hypothetical protein
MKTGHDAREMYKRIIAAFSDDGKLSVEELDHILQAALRDGEFQAEEKRLLIDMISQLSAADFTPEIWNRVEELVREFKLDQGV